MSVFGPMKLGRLAAGPGGPGAGPGAAADAEEAEQRPLDLQLIRRLFRYTRPYARKRNMLFFLVALRGAQMPTLAFTLGAVMQGPIAGGDWRLTLWGAAAYLALAAITQFTFHYRIRLAQELGEFVVHDIRNELFEHLQTLSMGYFNRTKVGRIISRFISDVEAMRVGVQDVLFVSMVQLVQGLGAAVAMAWIDWRLFCLVVGIAPVIWAINRYFRRRISQAYRALQESFSRLTATLAEAVGGIRVTQGFVRQDVNAALFQEQVEDHSEYNMAAARVSTGLFSLLEFNSQFFVAALVLLGGYLALRPTLSFEEARRTALNLVPFFFLARLFFEPINVIGRMYNDALTAMAGAERVFRVLDTKPDWEDPPDAVELPPIQGRVEFQEVSFEYVPGRPVLHEISFAVQPGQTVALVGPTGSGKTTIVNLISKFYLPTSGRILIDGYDITRVRTESLHRQMGIVLQSNFLFTGTVMENIKVGRPTATDEEVIEAARRLDVLDLIEGLAEGFNTFVGEGGANMSLGQRQIICFCRAMLADPRILILDEATSSVDTMTEARIQQALARLLKGRTSFVVAHRLSTIRQADVILVLDHGRIVERGSHRQLLATGGVYAQLYRRFIRAGKA